MRMRRGSQGRIFRKSRYRARSLQRTKHWAAVMSYILISLTRSNRATWEMAPPKTCRMWRSNSTRRSTAPLNTSQCRIIMLNNCKMKETFMSLGEVMIVGSMASSHIMCKIVACFISNPSATHYHRPGLNSRLINSITTTNISTMNWNIGLKQLSLSYRIRSRDWRKRRELYSRINLKWKCV